MTKTLFKNDCEIHEISAPVSTKAFVCNPLMDTRVVFLFSIVVRLISGNFFSLCPL